jgi:hypothetical protein
MGKKSRTVLVAGKIIGETKGAFLFSDATHDAWFPKSQVYWYPDAGMLQMQEWLAKRKGFL